LKKSEFITYTTAEAILRDKKGRIIDMKTETMNSNSVPFGISLVPETEDDKEILKKFFYNGVRTTAYNTINGHLILEGPLERRQTDTKHNITGYKPIYSEYVDYMFARGWNRQSITIDQNSADFAYVNSVNKGNTGNIIRIRCPSCKIMSVMNKKEAFQGKDRDLMHFFGLYITDEDGKEIPDDTKIRIVKGEPSVTILQLERPLYSDIKMKNGDVIYGLEKSTEFHGGEYLIIYVINSQKDIRSENIQFKMKFDLWSKNI